MVSKDLTVKTIGFSQDCVACRKVCTALLLPQRCAVQEPSLHVGTMSPVAANCDNSNFSPQEVKRPGRKDAEDKENSTKWEKGRSETGKKNVCRQLSSTLLSKWINPGYRPRKMDSTEKDPVCGMINAALCLATREKNYFIG